MRCLKILKRMSLATSICLLITATSIPALGKETSTVNVEPKYTTITEGFDWGPAITKVVLNMNTRLKTGAVSVGTFNVKSQRKYSVAGKDYDITKDRKIIDAYVSDEYGNKANMGNCVTIEMQVGPTVVEGSPFVNDFVTGFNRYADTSYIISLNEGKKIINKDSDNIVFNTITKKDNSGNRNLILDDSFNITGVSSYKDDTYGDIALHYASYAPKKNSKKNPLIVWLHGAGGGGTNPMIPLLGNEVKNLVSDETQKIFNGAYILVPQSDTFWMNNGAGVYTTDGTSKYTKALMNLIENYVKDHPDIDISKIYIGGCSNGGYMTMNMIMKYPHYFAAAFPICEPYYDEWITDDMLKGIKDIPIWFTHAATDPVVVPAKSTIPTYKRLMALGAKNVHFSYFDKVVDTTGLYKDANGNPYEYMGHFSWIYALNNECTKDFDGSNVKLNGKDTTLMEWLASQSKAN